MVVAVVAAVAAPVAEVDPMMTREWRRQHPNGRGWPRPTAVPTAMATETETETETMRAVYGREWDTGRAVATDPNGYRLRARRNTVYNGCGSVRLNGTYVRAVLTAVCLFVSGRLLAKEDLYSDHPSRQV